MPAPRALLRDIAAQGLNPSVAYHTLGKDGRIHDHRVLAVSPVVSAHKPVPPPATQKAEPVKVELTDEDKKVETEVPAIVDDNKDTELPVIPEGTEEVVLASSKKNKAKKVDVKVEAPKPVEDKKAEKSVS